MTFESKPSCVSMDHLIERESEFPLLQEVVYLDHAGSSLHCASQLNLITEELRNHLHCNPHSSFDGRESNKIHECRSKVLRHLNASEETYRTVFTSGSTASLEMIGHLLLGSGPNVKFYYLDECHTSVSGLRELAHQYKCFKSEDMDTLEPQFFGNEESSLVAFPAMSNFCGTKFPIQNWIHELRSIEKYFQGSKKIYILLDAACFVSSNQLDLSPQNQMDPDFVVLSFYKIFGHPTGIGALVLKDECLKLLLRKKKYFGGGTVQMSLVRRNKKVLKVGTEGLEDGTLPYQQILASIHGFNFVNTIGMTRISNYTFYLAQKCYLHLRKLVYCNGNPLISFNIRKDFNDPNIQGAIINFNILNPDGSPSGFSKFAYLCSALNIHVRVGCFCNIGACSRYLNLTDDDIESNYEAGHTCGDDVDLIDGRPSGSIRISFGYYNNESDIQKVIQLLVKYYLQHPRLHLTTKVSECIILRKIFLYPIKSCAAYSVNDWSVTSAGLLYDRQWLVLQGNKILSQKNEPLLALIKPRIDLEKNILCLSFSGLDSQFNIDLKPSRHTFNVIACVGKVCGETISGFDEGEAASLWLEECLGLTGLKLIRLSERSSMNNLSNSAEFLILNWSSLVDLTMESSLQKKDPLWMMNQFRANLVFDSTHIYEERAWKQLISRNKKEVTFDFKDTCKRCKMLNIDQNSAEKSQEPMTSLSRMSKNSIEFGILASCMIHCDDAKVTVGQKFNVYQ